MAGSGSAPQLRIGLSEAWSALPTRPAEKGRSALPTRLTKSRRPCQHAVLHPSSPARFSGPRVSSRRPHPTQTGKAAGRAGGGYGPGRLGRGQTMRWSRYADVSTSSAAGVICRIAARRRTSPRVAGRHRRGQRKDAYSRLIGLRRHPAHRTPDPPARAMSREGPGPVRLAARQHPRAGVRRRLVRPASRVRLFWPGYPARPCMSLPAVCSATSARPGGTCAGVAGPH